MVKKAEKTPLLFIHGFRGAPKGLEEIASPLRSLGYPVFIPEIPPTGINNSLPSYDPETYAEFIKNYIEANEIEKPVLIGHSMGSIICAAFAEIYPNISNEKLILLSPIASKVIKPIANLSSLITLLPNRPIDILTFKYLYVGKQKQNKRHAWELSKTQKTDFSSNLDLRASAKFSSKFTVSDFNFKKDSLFILGNKDRLVSIKKAKKLAEKYHAKLKIVENTGHILTYENPTSVAEIIQEFLS